MIPRELTDPRSRGSSRTRVPADDPRSLALSLDLAPLAVDAGLGRLGLERRAAPGVPREARDEAEQLAEAEAADARLERPGALQAVVVAVDVLDPHGRIAVAGAGLAAGAGEQIALVADLVVARRQPGIGDELDSQIGRLAMPPLPAARRAEACVAAASGEVTSADQARTFHCP